MRPMQSQFQPKTDGMPDPNWQNKVTYATPTPTPKAMPVAPRSVAPKPTPKIYVGSGPGLGGGMIGGGNMGGGGSRRDWSMG